MPVGDAHVRVPVGVAAQQLAGVKSELRAR